MNLSVAPEGGRGRRAIKTFWPLMIISLGFVSSAAGSALGNAPPWPIRWVWMAMAVLVAASIVIYMFVRSAATLRLTTITIVFAAATRGLGYLFAQDIAWGARLSAAGAWSAVIGLAMIRHRHRRIDYF